MNRISMLANHFDDEPQQYEEKKPTFSIASDIKREVQAIQSDVSIVRQGITLSKIKEIYARRYGHEISSEQLAGLLKLRRCLRLEKMTESG